VSLFGDQASIERRGQAPPTPPLCEDSCPKPFFPFFRRVRKEIFPPPDAPPSQGPAPPLQPPPDHSPQQLTPHLGPRGAYPVPLGDKEPPTPPRKCVVCPSKVVFNTPLSLWGPQKTGRPNSPPPHPQHTPPMEAPKGGASCPKHVHPPPPPKGGSHPQNWTPTGHTPPTHPPPSKSHPSTLVPPQFFFPPPPPPPPPPASDRIQVLSRSILKSQIVSVLAGAEDMLN